MKKVLWWIASVAIVVCLGASSASAAGFGVYGSLGSGSADWTLDDWSSSPNITFDTDSGHQGAGFVLDTAVAKDSFFNYQLNMGYDKFTNKRVGSGEKFELSGLMISNAFGFGIVRTPGFRMWMGPEIRLAWPNGSKDGVDYDFFGIGVGPVLGMNFNLPGTVTFAVKAGYQFMNYTGEANASSADYDINEKMIYVNIGILFRSSGDFF